MTVALVPRAAWGAVAPVKPVHRVSDASRSAFVVHYLGPAPGPTDPAERLRDVQAFHIGPQRGWADVAYNLAVGLNGLAYEGRGWSAVGAHRDGWNRKGYGVVVLYGQGERLTVAALSTLAGLYREACRRSGRLLQLVGHGEQGGATECPGPELLDVLDTWRRADLAAALRLLQTPGAATVSADPTTRKVLRMDDEVREYLQAIASDARQTRAAIDALDQHNAARHAELLTALQALHGPPATTTGPGPLATS